MQTTTHLWPPHQGIILDTENCDHGIIESSSFKMAAPWERKKFWPIKRYIDANFQLCLCYVSLVLCTVKLFHIASYIKFIWIKGIFNFSEESLLWPPEFIILSYPLICFSIEVQRDGCQPPPQSHINYFILQAVSDTMTIIFGVFNNSLVWWRQVSGSA